MIAIRDWLVSDFVEEYIDDKLLAGSERTPPEYRSTVRQLDRVFERSVRLVELSEPLLCEFKRRRLAEGRPATTVNKDLRHLLPLWRLAHKRGFCPDPPDVEFLQEPERLPEAWTLEQYGNIIDACDPMPPVLGVPGVRFWRSLLSTFYDSAFRVSAMMLLPEPNVDLLRGVVTAPWSTQKDNADHAIELSLETVEEIMLYEKYRPRNKTLERHGLAGLMWCWPWDRTVQAWPTLTREYRKILRRAKLPVSGKDMFHKLRRTTATQMFIANGLAAAQVHLGHSHPSVTKRYIDRKQARLITSARSLPRPRHTHGQSQLFD